MPPSVALSALPRTPSRGRRGSPFSGMGTVMWKELADHLSSARMRVLEALILLTAAGAVYAAISRITETVGEDRFLFLRIFTLSQDPLPSFVGLLGFLIPLVAISLGFDSVNGEFNRRTLSRVLSQPLYRDALLAGKFLAGLGTLSVALVALWLMMTGLGLLLMGVPPSGEEVLRGLGFLVVAVAYGGVWLALAMLFSVAFRSPATSALGALSVWLVFAVFWPMLVPLVAGLFYTPIPTGPLTVGAGAAQVAFEQGAARISPNTLFSEAARALLSPETRSLGSVFLSDLQGMLIGSPLRLSQSLILAWPQITSLVAEVILVFTAAYVAFQRQEVRA